LPRGIQELVDDVGGDLPEGRVRRGEQGEGSGAVEGDVEPGGGDGFNCE